MELTYTAVSALLRQEIRNMKPRLTEPFADEDHFMNDLGLDSLDLTEFVARIELNYRVEVDDADWKSLSSIQAATDYVLNRTHAPANG
jgi:acyl carrier protein